MLIVDHIFEPFCLHTAHNLFVMMFRSVQISTKKTFITFIYLLTNNKLIAAKRIDNTFDNVCEYLVAISSIECLHTKMYRTHCVQ